MEEEFKEEGEIIPLTPPEKINLTKKIRENPWILSTFVFGVLIVVLIIGTFGGRLTGNVISGEKAADNLVKFASAEDREVVVNSIETESGLYKLDINLDDKPTSLYVTMDGKNLINGLIPFTSETQSQNQPAQNIPKSDKPSVELYVFTYCPYGTQMEKAMIPVAKLLGDKISFKIRQIGAMHGEYEKIEAERQLCIEKNYPDKFLDYVLAFASDEKVGACKGDAVCVKPLINAIYTQLGIDETKINECMTAQGETLYNAEVDNSNKQGVSGSPTVMINNAQASLSRSPDAVKTSICSAFNTVPSECSQTLSTSQASAGFGSGTSSGSAASCG